MVRRAKPEPVEVPSLPELSGSVPGMLDPTQPSRLLRSSQSTIFFAKFDPDIAVPHGISRLSNMSLNDEKCRPKRIVIESIPGRGSFWRWVPRARKMEHVIDEGNFPRPVNICGQLYLVSQDQWDIYKLDPLYDCFVDDFCRSSLISRKEPGMFDRFNTPPSSAGHAEPQPSTSAIPVEGEEDEKMIVDDDNTPFNPLPTGKCRARPKRRATPERFNFAHAASASFEKAKSKRTAEVSFQSLRSPGEEENAYFQEDSQNRNTKQYLPKIQKRARTLSPSTTSRNARAHRNKRKTAQQARRYAEDQARKQRFDQNLMRDLLSEVPQFDSREDRFHEFYDIPEEDSDEAEMEGVPHTTKSSGGEQPEEKTEAQIIADSRRKMAELNTDRERQRLREQHDRGEEDEARKARFQARRREESAQRRAEEEERRNDAEARIRQQQEQARLQEEERQRRANLLEHLDRERELRHRQWESGLWTHARAVERFRVTSIFFDKAKFSEETLPLTLIDIPWPTLRHPRDILAQDIDWESVAEFFSAAKDIIRGQQYKEFMRLSFHRFHPDRWSSRNLYTAVLDEEQRNEITTAVSTVSKAVGALYSESRESKSA